MNTEGSRNSLFGPVLLIGLGILFLLSNFGLLTIDIWDILLRFWPVLLIIMGLDVLLGRRSGIGGLLALLLIAVLIFGSFGWFDSVALNADSGEAQTIRQELAGAQRAEINIAAGVSQLVIDTNPATEQLIEGSVVPHSNENIISSFSQEDNTATYTLKSEGLRFTLPSWGRRNRGLWDLRLSQSVPIQLKVSTGVGEAELNLERVQLSSLDVDSGVGQTTITLPGRGDFQAEINGGVGEVIVLIPDSLAARIRASAGIGSVNVEGDFTRDGKTYLSPNYESAENKVDLNVDGGVGAITIRQIEKR
jgi:hypothetical protein